jgi:DNA-binding NarL/FixJ family response regulator
MRSWLAGKIGRAAGRRAIDPLSLTITLAVVEDEPFMRDLLRIALAQQPGLEIAGVFGDAETALHEIPKLDPRVAILDIDLGAGPSGIQVGLLLREQCPDLGVVLLSNHFVPRFIATLPPETMRGWCYLLKKSLTDVEALQRAIEGAANGLVVLDPFVVAQREPRPSGAIGALTARQREILSLLAQGFSNAAIAEHLSLAVSTVASQVEHIYHELGVETNRHPDLNPRVQAVLRYLLETRAGDDGGLALR